MLHRLFPLTLLLFAAAGLVTADPPSRVAIRDARVYTVSGPVLEKATVLIKDGLIEAVGENIPIPAGVTVIDGTGLNVYPGLIDALSTWAVSYTHLAFNVTSIPAKARKTFSSGVW